MFKRGTITDDNKYNKQRKAVTPLADPPIVKALLPLEIIFTFKIATNNIDILSIIANI